MTPVATFLSKQWEDAGPFQTFTNDYRGIISAIVSRAKYSQVQPNLGKYNFHCLMKRSKTGSCFETLAYSEMLIEIRENSL